MTLLEIVRQRLADLENVEFSGPASDSDVRDVQQMFGKRLPGDYVEFLKTFGAGAVESEEFVGVGGPEHLDVRRVTERLRTPSSLAPFDTHLIPLSADGGGNYDCIDLNRSSPTTSVIVSWHHAGGGDARGVVETGYWDWVLRVLAEMADDAR